MAILAINFTAARRRKLGNVLFIIHLICAACGLAFFGLGIYIKIRLSAWMQLIDGYNDNLLPLMMVIVGSLLVVVDISGGRLVKSVENTSRLRHLLIPYLCIAFILSLCILTAGSICFAHRKNLSSAFHRGLTHAMQRYQNNNTFKTKIDYVQIEFECCGNLGYEDWFDVQWVNNKYIDLEDPEVESKMTNGRFLNDDVPFSCCDPGSSRHCIHHHIHDNDMHYNYDYRTDLTIFPEGCKAKLIGYYSFRLSNVGAIVMAMFVMQVGILIGLRYLQTAVHNSQKDPEGDSKGWLIKRLPAKETKPDWREERDVESGDVEEESGSAASAQSGTGSESYEDSFESDTFDSDDRTGGDVQGKATAATPASQQQVQKEEPVYANLPFHQDKERLQETLQDATADASNIGKEKMKSEKQSTVKESKKKSSAKKESPKKDSSKKDSKKSGSSKKASKTSPKKDSKVSKSPKKETKAKSSKKTSPSKKQSPAKKKTSSPKSKSKSVKKSPTRIKTSPKKSKSMKSKSPKSPGGSMKKSKKRKMKNKNNNIEDSSDESDISDTTPLLGKFYSSSEEEELHRDLVNSGVTLSSALHKSNNVNNNEGSPEVTWLLSRTQFYSAAQSFS